MPREANPDCFREEVKAFDVSVTLKELEPGGNLYVEHRHFDRRFRKSLRTKDREKARKWAEEHCKEIALRKEGGALGAAVRSNRLTLGELFDAFRERGIPKYEKEHSRGHTVGLRRAMRLLEHVWGRNLRLDRLDQQRIDEYVTRREERGIQLADDKYEPVSRTTTITDFTAFSSILSWAQKQQHEGEWLLPGVHPLRRVDLPAQKSEEEVSRPIADEERYKVTLEFAERIGTTDRHKGRRMLPTLLRVVRHTGRRRQAVVNLRWKDICFDREACERALRRGQAPVRRAREWPHGAIHWRPEYNKQSYGAVIPMSEDLAMALRRYRQEEWPPLLGQIAGERWRDELDSAEMPLFPSPVAPTNSICVETAHNWLNEAEQLAREAGRPGAPPADQEQDGFHAYRRWWSTERGHYDSEWGQKAVRVAGSWKTRGDTFRRVYLQIPAATLYRVVENESGEETGRGTVSLDAVDVLIANLVDRLSTGSDDEKLRRYTNLAEDERQQVLWNLVREAEKAKAQTSDSNQPT